MPSKRKPSVRHSSVTSAANEPSLASPEKWFPDDLPLWPSRSGLDQLATYIAMLKAWNQSINLVGFSEPAKIIRELVCDSFHLAPFLAGLVPAGTNPIIADLGAGAGLPGIPLRIVWTRGQYSLVEIRQKRALFLTNVLARLQLPATTVFHGSAADYFATPARATADIIISRAFMPWPELLQMCHPHLPPHGLQIVFANSRPDALPDDWHLVAAREYATDGKNRWLWALAPRNVAT